MREVGPTHGMSTTVAPIGLNFVGPFTPVATRIGNQYILVAMDYCTKWVESKALRDNIAASTAEFLYEYIWCRYGCPIELVSDQAGHFLGQVVESLTTFYAVSGLLRECV